MLVRRFVPVSELGRGAALFTAEIAQEAPHTAETRLHGGDLYCRVLIIQQDARRLVYPQTGYVFSDAHPYHLAELRGEPLLVHDKSLSDTGDSQLIPEIRVDILDRAYNVKVLRGFGFRPHFASTRLISSRTV